MIQASNQEHVLYRQGLIAHQSGDWGRAERFYRQALQAKPDWATVYYNLGVIADSQQRFQQAFQCYQKAVTLEPDYRQALENLGCVSLKQGDPEHAIAYFKQAIALDSEQPSLWNNLGQALYAHRHEVPQSVQHAIEAYRYALKLDPTLFTAQLNLGLLFQDRGDDEKALGCFEKVIEQDPDHVVAYSHCAQLYFRQGRVDNAIVCWQQFATLQAHLLRPYCYQILQETPLAPNEQHDDLLQSVRVASAQFLYGLLQKTPIAESRQWLQQAYEYLGRLLFQEAGGESQAEYCFRQALQITPNHPTLLLGLADCLAQQDRGEAATMLRALGKTVKTSSDAPLSNSSVSQESQPLGNKRNDSDRLIASAYRPSPLIGYATTSDWVKTTAIANVQYRPIMRNRVSPQVARSAESPKAILHSSEPAVCGGVTCPSCMRCLRQTFNPYQRVENIYHCGPLEHEPDDAKAFDVFTVTIPSGSVWMSPHKNEWKICSSMAVMTPDRILLADLSRDYPWQLPGCTRLGLQPHHSFKISLPPVKRLEGRVAVLSGLSGHVYYHWMMDVLPRFGLLQKAGWTWEDIDWFVVNSIQRPFQRETLERIGVPKDKILESDRHSHLQADELIVPSFPGPLDWPPMESIDFLRSLFLQDSRGELPSRQQSASPYLYISRAKAGYRRLLNEPQLLDALEKLGFVAVHLETLSVQQQAHLFANAKIVVAPHGAGLTNTIFCEPGTHIVELTSPRYIRTDYWIVSHRAGLNHYYIKGEGVECSTLRQLMYQSPLTEDIWLPVTTQKAMVNLLHSLMEQPAEQANILREEGKNTDG